MLNKSGIYKITNVFNNKCYIGSAVDIRKRWNAHKFHLNRNIHHSIKLQRAWNKYGEENFKFEVMLFCEKEELLVKEQKQIDWFRPEYNILKIAGSCLGRKHSEETILKMSKVAKGRKQSPEHIEKLSKIRKGKPSCTKGISLTFEHKNKLSKSQIERFKRERELGITQKGKKMSKEACEKMSKSKKGKKVKPEVIARRVAVFNKTISERKIKREILQAWTCAL